MICSSVNRFRFIPRVLLPQNVPEPNLHRGPIFGENVTLVDRVFHLHTLDAKDEFEAFEKWSFIRQFETNNNIWSDTFLTDAHKVGVPKPNAQQKARYKQLKQERVSWREPKPDEAAKSLDMMFLYKFGYDVASRFLHPLATDGVIEFEYLAQVGGKGDRGDQRVIIHNACLTVTLLLNLAVNAAQRQWRTLLFEAIDDIRKALAGEAQKYAESLDRVAGAPRTYEWSKQRADA